MLGVKRNRCENSKQFPYPGRCHLKACLVCKWQKNVSHRIAIVINIEPVQYPNTLDSVNLTLEKFLLPKINVAMRHPHLEKCIQQSRTPLHVAEQKWWKPNCCRNKGVIPVNQNWNLCALVIVVQKNVPSEAFRKCSAKALRQAVAPWIKNKC